MKDNRIKMLVILFSIILTNCVSREASNNCQEFNESITIINIGNLNRVEILNLAKKIQTKKPAVIGIDVIFKSEKPSDSILMDIIYAKNVVLTASVVNGKLKKSYFKNHLFGINDIGINKKNRVVDFLTYIELKNNIFKSFAVQILEKYSREVKIDKKTSNIQNIEYNGNCLCFPTADYRKIDYLKDEYIEGNIVLLGYLGENFSSINCTSDNVDIFPTDFNDGEKMYGTVITANVLYTLMKQYGIK